jgi:hypothetical protein
MSEIHVKLGKLLQLERQRRKLSLADMAVELKISEANLEHIENGEVGSLPGELYFNRSSRQPELNRAKNRWTVRRITSLPFGPNSEPVVEAACIE